MCHQSLSLSLNTRVSELNRTLHSIVTKKMCKKCKDSEAVKLCISFPPAERHCNT